MKDFILSEQQLTALCSKQKW